MLVIRPPQVTTPRWFALARRNRLGRWLIARRLGLRCLVCNRRAGYGGRCPNNNHNG